MVMRLPGESTGVNISHRASVRQRDRIRVALVEDKRMTREGLGAILGAAAELDCVGLYASVEAALPGLASDPCDVLLLDIHLPGMSGVEGVRVFKDRFPDMQILMLTIYEEEEKVFDSICNGASGYLLKKTPPAEIIEAVRQARRGGSPLSPEVARQIVQRFRGTRAVTRRESPLTPQELYLLKLLADGHSYQSAAQNLGISINTVRDHVRSVYEKLHVHSKSQAVGKALRDRLIE
jgi:DNA-binding NarL/FixJ family response regulator